MEAATTLPFTRVRTFNGELLVDGLRVDDESAVRLAREREMRGESPDGVVRAMVAVGARVLEREDTGAQTDFVRAEFDRLRADFTERARVVAERLDAKVDEAFGSEHGHVSLALERHFGDGSSAAVQHKVRAAVAEVTAQMREDVRKQLTSDTEDNPIVAIQRASLKVMQRGADQQHQALREMNERLAAMRVEMTELKAEKQRLADVAAAEDRGTAKGRTYEEAVYEALDAIAVAQGDDCDAVGDVPGVGGRKGDVVVALDACAGPARGRIVFEAKNSKLSKKEALAELDEAKRARGADYAVFVVPSEDKLPAKTRQLREFNGDKLFVVFDPEDGSRLALEVAFTLARARVLMARGDASGLDADAVRGEVERALGALEEVRRIKQQLTHARNGIEEARTIVDAMAAGVRGHLTAIGGLLDAAGADDAEPDAPTAFAA